MNTYVTSAVSASERPVTFASDVPNIDLAKQFLVALLGPNAPVTVRLIWQKSAPVQGANTHTFQNPNDSDWATISFWNVAGYSVFFFANELDGNGTSDHNVTRVRSNFVDLDNISTATESAKRIVHV
ncbi:hypothetical protein E3U26_03195 [Paracoccus ferrooxidans]|nr:hypothetical protein E3U26_03195 [Paracoccus ferrooxidans]